jgi:hypothetical protein
MVSPINFVGAKLKIFAQTHTIFQHFFSNVAFLASPVPLISWMLARLK